MLFQYQVYLVMGGKGGSGIGRTRLDTTEQLTEGAKKWKKLEATKLPRPLMDLRAITLGNIVYLTGQVIYYLKLQIQ